jgi:hypothetical protein
MNLLNSTLELQNGGWIIDDKTNESLVYRKAFGDPTYRVRYQRSGPDFTLQRSVEVTCVDKGTSFFLNEEKALPVIAEIIDQLKKAGISSELQPQINLNAISHS